ncbi:hypothetical protein ASPZODRAFT_1968823 [Penicilliopsis zonata CBS 506.65]|uniref:Uncharacterized protein n=1 Tax=Penicilliopsis zonata CBS 506.65 TaxID=1073090 RepID=A0A1L9SH78_9EURO|nr:hypothetical protein ASPZODRAFT_1968823 [Penicilliopsis zonata CBS 506.65]OJJ46511.1 hypothetical protein ASPZODRAFT_1968823 [Penicilliopsis zonata CBS 506.65]
MFSFFGPCHGRILQARFHPSGRLVIRASNIYSFENRKEHHVVDLFLRFWLSEPCFGEEYEFYVNEDSSETPPLKAIVGSAGIPLRPKLFSRYTLAYEAASHE